MEKTLGDSIRWAIERSRMSIPEFARAAEIDTTHLYRLVSGKVGNPRIDTLLRICATSGLPFPELLSRAGLLDAANPRQVASGSLAPEQVARLREHYETLNKLLDSLE